MRAKALFVAIALWVLPLAPAGAASRITNLPPEPQLRLHRATFDARTPEPAAPASTFAAAAPGPYAIIQFRGPVTVADRAALEQTGVTLLEYLPDFAYLARGTADQLDAAARLPQVYARTPFTLADKLAPALLRALARGETSFGPVRVVGWPDDAGQLARDLSAAAAPSQTTASTAVLLQLAELESVRWIEPVGDPRILNDYARAIMQVDPVWQNHQLFGAGQIIAIADSGLDTGDMDTMSPDFAGRIAATHVLSPTGDLGDNFGHGTHVAGSVAGAGVQSGADPAGHDYAGSFAGVAPEASLDVQAFEILSDGSIVGLDPDYYPLFAQAYADGARLHTNSWGDSTDFGSYPYGSQRTDKFVWENPDMAIFFAAGNSGQDGTGSGICFDGDGVVDPDSLLAPGTAKNVITVGATESNRSDSGLGATPWLLLSLCFLAQPIALDPLADNANGMAAFSSRGPVDDGRVKPDLVAPGTNIVSNKSHYTGATELWGPHETNSDYVYSGGTSMATPLAAGMGALVRQWLTTRGLTDPSAAAIKAVLLDTTADIAPGQYGTGATQEIPFNRPNNVAGWGRADLGFVEAPTPYALWMDDHTTGLATGENVDYLHTDLRPLTVVTNTQPLRSCWPDRPARVALSRRAACQRS
jgi:subtilisin family serine protease